jgi:Protein of unknown function (DUF664)
VIEAAAKAHLHDHLRWVRRALVWKLDGLSENDVSRPLTLTGTNLLGLVKHTAICDARYVGEVFQRPFPEPIPRWDDPTAGGSDHWATERESRADVIDLYPRVWARSDATIAELGLEWLGPQPPALGGRRRSDRSVQAMTAAGNAGPRLGGWCPGPRTVGLGRALTIHHQLELVTEPIGDVGSKLVIRQLPVGRLPRFTDGGRHTRASRCRFILTDAEPHAGGVDGRHRPLRHLAPRDPRRSFTGKTGLAVDQSWWLLWQVKSSRAVPTAAPPGVGTAVTALAREDRRLEHAASGRGCSGRREGPWPSGPTSATTAAIAPANGVDVSPGERSFGYGHAGHDDAPCRLVHSANVGQFLPGKYRAHSAGEKPRVSIERASAAT